MWFFDLHQSSSQEDNMMSLIPFSALWLIVLSAVVSATNIEGDPTDLANWPTCAVRKIPLTLTFQASAKTAFEQQNCIPLGFAPPASCSSLSDLTCICQNPQFSLQIAVCERETCNSEEFQRSRPHLSRRENPSY